MSDEVVTVFQTGDAVLVALAKAALDAEQIPYVARGDAVQDVIGMGRFPGGFNVLTGPVRFQVAPADADRASSALKDLKARSEDPARRFVPPRSWYWQKRGLALVGVGFGFFLLIAVLLGQAPRLVTYALVSVATVCVVAGLVLIGAGLKADSRRWEQ